MLTLLLLGPPEVRHAGRLATFATRKALALLIYLAVEGGSHSREKLMALLWPESDDERARMALRRNLAYLREAIGDSGPTPDTTHLHTTRSTLTFIYDEAESDVQVLDATWTQLRAIPVSHSDPALLAQLQQTVVRYRGDFLDGFSLSDAPAFDDWAALQREVWHHRMGLAYERLAELQFAAADWVGAIDTTARWIAHYPLNEAAHRHMIRTHLSAGNRPAAMRAYEACCALLDAELGATPSPETEALSAQIHAAHAATPASKPIAAATAGHVTAAARPPTLPAPPNALIGRDDEVAAIVQALRDGVRLLTLLGPPGIGKTRLAIQVAEAAAALFNGDVWFVPLATVTDPQLVAPAILAALEQDDDSRSPSTRLREALRSRHILLVLDNFEHVITAATLVSELLSAAALLTVLVTSRSPLQIYGEYERVVAPLALPNLAHLPAAEVLTGIAAVRLFLERTRAVRPDLRLTHENSAAIAAVCVRLDGLPLAIELAAARMRVLAPQALLEQLDEMLNTLVDGPRDHTPRQQTLRGAIAWSDALLMPDDRLRFAQLGIFVGGWTLAAAKVICVVEAQAPDSITASLARLVEANLIIQMPTPDQDQRFSMLQAIHEYAREQQGTHDIAEEVQHRHILYYRELVEAIEPQLKGPAQALLLGQLEREHGNLRAALACSLAQRDLESSLRLCAGLWWFWFVRGHLSEGRRWITAALALDEALDRPEAYAASRLAALNGGGVLAHDQGDYEPAAALLEASLSLARQLGNQRGIGAALNNLGLVARSRGDYPRADAYYRESLASARGRGDEWATAVALSNLGMVAAWQGDHTNAIHHYDESLALRRAMGDTRGIAVLLNSLADSLLYVAEIDRAAILYAESLTLQRELDDRAGASDALYGLGQVAHVRGVSDEAIVHLRDCLAIRDAIGDRRGIAECLESGAAIAAEIGDPVHAAQLLSAGQVLREAVGAPIPLLDRPAHEYLLATVRATLGEEAFAHAWLAGAALGNGTPEARAATLAML